MELIKSDVEFWKQELGIEGMWKQIERCTRVCYQSERKNNSETSEEFVKRTILSHKPDFSIKNHLAMLEHGTVYLVIPFDQLDSLDESIYEYQQNPYTKCEIYEDDCYITTNMRVLVENDWEEDLKKWWCDPTPYHTLRYTFSFKTDIGVSRELNRHRINSICEESTRYCNYSKDKFGSNITYLIPDWLNEYTRYIENHQFDSLSSYCEGLLNEEERIWCDIDYWMLALTMCEFAYKMLITKGWKPQQAREVLPLATKTQVVHTAFKNDWEHFIALRSDGISGAPHPNMKILAQKIKELFSQIKKEELWEPITTLE